MTNPASKLADLFESWELNNQRPRFARGGEGIPLEEFWRGQAEAAVLLHQVDLAVDALRDSGTDTRGFEPFMVAWHEGLFSADYPWAGNHTGPAVKSEALASLRTLAVILDWTDRAAPATASQVAELKQLIRDVRDLLAAEGSGLGPEEVQYLLRLVGSVEDGLEEHAVSGKINLRAHLDRLNGALVSAAAQVAADGDEAAGQKLWGVALRFVSAYRGLLGDAAAVAAITGQTLAQLN